MLQYVQLFISINAKYCTNSIMLHTYIITTVPPPHFPPHHQMRQQDLHIPVTLHSYSQQFSFSILFIYIYIYIYIFPLSLLLQHTIVHYFTPPRSAYNLFIPLPPRWNNLGTLSRFTLDIQLTHLLSHPPYILLFNPNSNPNPNPTLPYPTLP